MTTTAFTPFDAAPEPFPAAVASLADEWQPLDDKPEETLEGTVRALWFAAVGDPHPVRDVADMALPTLDEPARARLRSLIARRRMGEPLAYLTGRQRFAGIELLAAPGALIPRIETELLARTATEKLRAMPMMPGGRRALDLCTGSGNVALALASQVADAIVDGCDLSVDAIALAKRNARFTRLDARATFAAGDLFTPVDDPAHANVYSLVTCNPPYISSSKVGTMHAEIAGHEPRLAFDGGRFGLDVLLRTIKDAPRFLVPGGWLCIEVGRGQGEFVLDRMRRAGTYTTCDGVADAAGATRVVTARLAAE
jgi:release factor glutamine methyltransferase